MKLGKIISSINCLEVANFKDRDIVHVFSDSREKFKDSIFIAVKGLSSDGAEFASDAVESGACAIIYETSIPRKFPGVTYIKVSDCRIIQSKVAGLVYSHPASKLDITGITGTNGKTSTAYIFRHILNINRIKCGLLGTTEYDLGKRIFTPSRTTPDAVFLQRYFREMVSSGLKYAVMEVSSHALSLHRVEDVFFNRAVFTNLSQDHLDFHNTMDEYAGAKALLFSSHLKEGGTPVVNSDDGYSGMITGSSPHALTYSWNKPDADLVIKGVKYLDKGMEISFMLKGNDYTVETSLNGKFQAMNIAAAVLSAIDLGIPVKDIVKSLKEPIIIPGRLEKVYEDGYSVYIDYAHTPDALFRTLSTVREFCSGRIITVFGCGGNRDRDKRPKMGKIASELSDLVIVTDDNPRMEDPDIITDEILSGIRSNNWVKISGRKEAVREALSAAGKGDVVIVAGKGHENYQEIKGVKYPFSDKETVMNITGRSNG
jgi:UDP-N-acetylmuramoyl-L-alanyl-D-glutamate--2,6-diaminopimelate ligase